MVHRLVRVLTTAALAVPLVAAAAYHRGGAPDRQAADVSTPTPTSDITVVSPTPITDLLGGGTGLRKRGKLREAQHAEKLIRVQGLATGMTNKLTNLSNRLNTHLANVEKRMAALEAAGHDLTVDTELATAKAAAADVQAFIASALSVLQGLPDSETPRAQIREARALIRQIRTKVRVVRAAFRSLRLAIRSDVRESAAQQAASSPSPSPALSTSPTPLVLFSPTPSPSPVGSPSPVAF